jgi:hypothetical protein
MSDTSGPFTPPRHEIIDFHGDQLIAVVLEGDGVAIPLRLLCERIGLDADAQAERLRSHAVLAAGLRVVNVEIGGRVRSVMAIIHTKIPFWLATISPEQVNDETRPKLIQYQTELADILARLFFGQFKVEMGIPRYDALPIDKYDTAVAWIERKAAELLPGDSDAVAPRQKSFL